MKPFVFTLLVTLLSCRSGPEALTGPERTELAYLHDTSQFADGCEPYVEIDTGNASVFGTQYKPTPASLPVFQRAFKDLVGSQPYSSRVAVRIQFVETTRQVVVQCGWVSPTVSEIKVLAIIRR